MATPPISEVITTTLRNRSEKLADNVSKNNALLTRLKSKGQMTKKRGGRTIFCPLMYAENSTFMFYSGYQVLNINPSDVLTAAEFDWKQASTVVTASGLEMDVQNVDPEAVIDWLEARIGVAERTMANNMSIGIYSDGTGYGGLQTGGLQLLVADNPATGTVGGIPAANWTFWRNQKITVSAFTTTTIQSKMNSLYVKTIRGNDAPDLAPCDNLAYLAYLGSLQSIQRITDPKLGEAGFQNLKFMNMDVVLDGGLGGACPANHMYFLNTDYIKFVTAAKRNFVPLEERNSINQDAMVRPVVWAGNMIVNNRSLQGVLSS